ncbi:MAG: LysR family transcriptional regulator [Neorhizobium sp.]|nr:LysR family transcriptional regulator [Neorhizobium sp.]
METAWLADLQSLAETLNFSRAAERRNVTQPAFGRRIRALEEWCGAQLVDRSTHRLRLTPEGEIMLGAASEITDRLDRARHQIEQARAATSAVTFAATHALSFIFFPHWVQSLGQIAATTPMRLLSDDMNECERIMADGRAQFLLCHHHEASRIRLDEQTYRYLQLSTDRLVPVSSVAPGTGDALHRLPGTARSPVPYLAFAETSGMGRILASSLGPRMDGLHLSTVFTSHLAMALKGLAIEGKGVAWIPQSLAAEEIRNGRLAVAGEAGWSIDVKIVLIRPRARMADLAETFWSLAQTRHGAI